MKRYALGIACVVCALAAGVLSAASRQQSPQKPATADVLLGQAMHQEQIEGQLDAAIATYKKVLASPGATREQKARAQFQIGACYERLGNTEAKRAYELVVQQYGDLTDFATRARTRLAALGMAPAKPAQTGLVARVLWEDNNASLGAISPDGRLFAYDDGRLKVRNLATGDTRDLTDFKDEWGFAWSPDGKQIGYFWYPRGEDKSEFRVIGVEGGTPRTLIYRPGLTVREPMDWSPDGKSIAVEAFDTEVHGIAVFNLSTSAIKQLHRTGADGDLAYGLRFSPDGRYLALSISRKSTREVRDVVVVAVDGSGETLLTDSKGRNEVVGWTPDGGGVVFVSDRGGSPGLWLIGVTGGRPAGEPRLLRADLGKIVASTTRVAGDGTVLYGEIGSTSDVMLASVDFKSGRVTAPPVSLVPKLAGSTRAGAWSPDGTRVAFLTEGAVPMPPVYRTLSLLDIVSGQTATFSLPISIPNAYPLRWSNDGEWVLTDGTRESTSGIFRITARTGETTLLARSPESAGGANLSSDGRHLYYARGARSTGSEPSSPLQRISSIHVRELASDQEQEFYRNDEGGFIPGQLPLSRDGQRMAFYYHTGGPSGQLSVLKVAYLKDRTVRQIYRTEARQLIGGIAWMPDSQALAVSIRSSDAAGLSSSTIWLVPIDGTPPRKTALTGGNMIYPSVHPDGQRLLYTVLASKPGQLWSLENVLPAPTPPKPKGAK